MHRKQKFKMNKFKLSLKTRYYEPPIRFGAPNLVQMLSYLQVS